MIRKGAIFMSAINAHGGINSPGWEQMRLNKAREAQVDAETEELQEPDKKKIRRNRIIAATLILLFLATCVYFIFFVPVAPLNML